jgi:hypothetical protein
MNVHRNSIELKSSKGICHTHTHSHTHSHMCSSTMHALTHIYYIRYICMMRSTTHVHTYTDYTMPTVDSNTCTEGPSLTHSLTHSLTYSLTHVLTYSLTHHDSVRTT